MKTKKKAATPAKKIRKEAIDFGRRVREQAIFTEGMKHGKQVLLTYLITCAQKTEGAEVWRCLFAEILGSLK